MLTLKELTSDYTAFSVLSIKFKSQTEVLYCLSDTGSKYRFSKADLIGCIKFYLNRLSLWIDINKIKHGFVLDKFKYYELSVYLHGLLQVYCGFAGFDFVGELFIEKFSHLPHDVMEPEKQTKHIEVSYLKDGYDGSQCYCCVIACKPVCASTYEGLTLCISNMFPNLVRKYNIVLDIRY